MKLPKIPLAQTVIKLCELKEIKHIVISPGSRNAPLTIGFTNHPYFECYSIVDERCAAFFALGMAQQLRQPVALVCTSGSAMLNYFPAVAEAYYSDIPLVILSADRPEHLIGIGDGQTIDQKNIYANHILYETNLSEDASEYNEKEINTALNKALIEQGPVHVNVPFNEPLYDLVSEFSVIPKCIDPIEREDTDLEISEFITQWNSLKKKMVLVGVNSPNTISTEFLAYLANDPSVIVFTETTSNIDDSHFFPSIDKIIAPLEDEDFKDLQPELLLTFGGMIVSKKIKAFLRQYKPKYHYHIDQKKAYDTFFCLTSHFKVTVNAFYNKLSDNLKPVSSHYQNDWLAVKTYRASKHADYLRSIPFSDLKVFEVVLDSLPNNVLLHSGNSSAIRYLQLFTLNSTLQVFCNRGTSGIDGSTATAIGAAVVTSKQNVFITGDLSFFYDSNALWNNYIPNNFRIILLNNGGGGIFRILPGHKNTENFDTYFETKHDLNARSLCEMYDIEYNSASELSSLKEHLSQFYTKSDRPKLLEIFTPRTLNDEVLINYFVTLK